MTEGADRGDGRGGDPTGFGTTRHRLRYRFDNLLARGTWATLVWLGVVTLVTVVLSGLLLRAFNVDFAGGEDDGGLLETTWQSLLRVLDTGTMAGDIGWGRRLLALAVTIFGLLVAGTLIGIIATGVEDRIERMRRGRTVVIESGHLVVLGAADQLPGLVQQVGLGASPARPSTVVVLAEGDPAVIDRRVRAAGFDRRAVRVVLRSGDPRLLADLHLVRPTRARGIVVLHDDEPHDARVVRTVLAVTELLGDTSTVPIVVEVREAGTTERLMDACGPMVHPLHTTAALARTAAFALRGPELGQVLDELLQVGGVDIQVRDGADVDGSSFGDLVRRSGSDRPIGLLGTDGVLELHPPDGRVLRAGEQLVSIGHAPGAPVPAARRREDHPARSGRARSATTTPAARAQRSGAPAGDDGRLLVVGWNMFGQWLLSEWADNAHGRAVEVVLAGRDASAAVPELPDATPLTVQRPTSLAAYLEARGGLGDLSTVVLLPAIDERDPEDADTRTLLDLGLLRRLRGDRPHPRFVVQLVDVDHVPLARLNGPDDWLIDPGAGAQLMVQLVDEPRRRAVLLALYADGGSSLAAVPARELGLVDQVRTSAVIQAATEAGLLALGWHRSLPDGPELVLAPATGAHVDLAPDDTIIVVT